MVDADVGVDAAVDPVASAVVGSVAADAVVVLEEAVIVEFFS